MQILCVSVIGANWIMECHLRELSSGAQCTLIWRNVFRVTPQIERIFWIRGSKQWLSSGAFCWINFDMDSERPCTYVVERRITISGSFVFFRALVVELFHPSFTLARCNCATITFRRQLMLSTPTASNIVKFPMFADVRILECVRLSDFYAVVHAAALRMPIWIKTNYNLSISAFANIENFAVFQLSPCGTSRWETLSMFTSWNSLSLIGSNVIEQIECNIVLQLKFVEGVDVEYTSGGRFFVVPIPITHRKNFVLLSFNFY